MSSSNIQNENDEECLYVEFLIRHQPLPADLVRQTGFEAEKLSRHSDVQKFRNTQLSLHRIAAEFLSTEKTYVSILHLLNEVFAAKVQQENKSHPMFSEDVVKRMFRNINSLYQLHSEFLLPKLQERLASWNTNPRIGDIMKELAPFLKIYSEYVSNYDKAMKLINTWYEKQPRFAKIVDEVHAMPDCGNLTIQHHMLTPVQRVPRYQLLLQEYLKKLPSQSPDRPDAEQALELVETAAHHANEAMNKIDQFKKLLEIQNQLGGVMDLVSPTRELIKEGKITKISARNGDRQERYVFLFSDLLLVCSQRFLTARVVSGPPYRVRAKLEVKELFIEEGGANNSFLIRNPGRSIELCTSTHEEKISWIQTLTRAIRDHAQREGNMKILNMTLRRVDSNSELGCKPPRLIPSETITHCMNCAVQFSTLGFRWKHHCYACGIVACSKCLPRKVKLAYFECGKLNRVCNDCYKALIKSSPANPMDDTCLSGDLSMYDSSFTSPHSESFSASEFSVSSSTSTQPPYYYSK